MQKLWKKPATNSTVSPSSGAVTQEKTRLSESQDDRADHHGARRSYVGAVNRQQDRARERAAGEAGDQPAQSGLVHAVDILGDVSQQRAHQG